MVAPKTCQLTAFDNDSIWWARDDAFIPFSSDHSAAIKVSTRLKITVIRGISLRSHASNLSIISAKIQQGRNWKEVALWKASGCGTAA